MYSANRKVGGINEIDGRCSIDDRGGIVGLENRFLYHSSMLP